MVLASAAVVERLGAFTLFAATVCSPLFEHDRLREAGYDRFYPGHRDVIEHPTGRIGAILEAHRERTETVAALLADPHTPFEVMTELFGDLPVTEQFSGMSEAVGHLDVLVEDDRAEQRVRDGTIVFERIE